MSSWSCHINRSGPVFLRHSVVSIFSSQVTKLTITARRCRCEEKYWVVTQRLNSVVHISVVVVNRLYSPSSLHCSHIGARLRYQSGWLLQLSARLTHIRRNDLHWLDVPERHVQTLRHGLQVSARNGTAIPVWTVPADLQDQHRRTPSTALSDCRRPRCSKMSTINIRQTGLLLRRSGSMELFTGAFEKQYINYRTI